MECNRLADFVWWVELNKEIKVGILYAAINLMHKKQWIMITTRNAKIYFDLYLVDKFEKHILYTLDGYWSNSKWIMDRS